MVGVIKQVKIIYGYVLVLLIFILLDFSFLILKNDPVEFNFLYFSFYT